MAAKNTPLQISLRSGGGRLVVVVSVEVTVNISEVVVEGVSVDVVGGGKVEAPKISQVSWFPGTHAFSDSSKTLPSRHCLVLGTVKMHTK